MTVGLIDEDWESRRKMTFPNLSLMKLSSWHKAMGDHVDWYHPIMGTYDIVYISRIFSNEYTKPYYKPVDSKKVIRGGSGYAIKVEDGKEVYHPELDPALPPEIDHAYPDYGLYGITDTAYGFLTKGCPRRCPFCHVKGIQGTQTYDFAPLSEFWHDQPNIKLLDPNLTASVHWDAHLKQLANSKAWVDFTQGLDARMLDKDRISGLNRIKFKRIHFAWDNPRDDLEGRFKLISEHLRGCRKETVSCYVLTNYDSSFEEDLYRVQTLRTLRIQPYVMIYRKPTAPKELKQLQRWCSPFIFWSVPTFEEYKKGEHA